MPIPAQARAIPRPARRSYWLSRPAAFNVSKSSAISAPDISAEDTDQSMNEVSRIVNELVKAKSRIETPRIRPPRPIETERP